MTEKRCTGKSLFCSPLRHKGHEEKHGIKYVELKAAMEVHRRMV